MNKTVAKLNEASVRRFKPYPAYKDPGVEWLGEIPSAWGLKRLKRVVQFQGGGTPSKDNFAYWHGEIPWVSPKDMKVSLVVDTEDKITPEAIRESPAKLVPAGAVLIVVRSGILVHSIPVALAGCEVTLNQDLKAMIPRSELVPQYLTYLISGMQRELLAEWKKEGATVESLELELVSNTLTPLPTIAEQHAIAVFLDRETAKIDALVAKKEQLTELLQVKRAALITRAVTKGLDPNVPMKDSGVPWLGRIPAHWEVRRIAMAAIKITNGYVGPTRDILVNEGVRYLQSLHIKEGSIDFERRAYFVTPKWSHQHEKSVLDEGDVLIVQTGDIGQVAVVPKEFAGCNCHALIIIRLRRSIGIGAWLARALESDYGQGALEWSQTGALHPHLECGHVRDIRVAFPPASEQVFILQKLTDALEEVDEMMSKVRSATDRLKEFRTALISAAVTGKIDVREQVV